MIHVTTTFTGWECAHLQHGFFHTQFDAQEGNLLLATAISWEPRTIRKGRNAREGNMNSQETPFKQLIYSNIFTWPSCFVFLRRNLRCTSDYFAIQFIVLIAAAIGCLFIARPRNRQTTLLWLANMAYTAVHMLFYVIFRYREPIMPLVCVLAALTFESLVHYD